jgi:hypothetical protein
MIDLLALLYTIPNGPPGPSPKRPDPKRPGPIRHDGNFVPCRAGPTCLGGCRSTALWLFFGPGRHGGTNGLMGRDSGRVRPGTICRGPQRPARCVPADDGLGGGGGRRRGVGDAGVHPAPRWWSRCIGRRHPSEQQVRCRALDDVEEERPSHNRHRRGWGRRRRARRARAAGRAGVRRRSLRRSKKGGAPGGRRDRVEVRRLLVGMGFGRRRRKGVRLLQGGKELGLG